MDVYCRHHPISGIRKMLDAFNIKRARDLKYLSSKSHILITGLLIFFHTPPTRSGKRVIFATLEDETGLFDLVILPHVQSRWAKTIYESEILTISGTLKREGFKGLSMSITVERVIEKLSGSLEELMRRVAVFPRLKGH